MLFVPEAFLSFRIGGEEVEILLWDKREVRAIVQSTFHASSTDSKDATAEEESPNALSSPFRVYFGATDLIKKKKKKKEYSWIWNG